MKREPMMMACIGMKGVGKTYRTRQEVAAAVKAGKKVLIFDATLDTEYKNYKTMIVADIFKFNASKKAEVRRICAVDKHGNELGTPEKIDMLLEILQNFKGGILVLEDLNNYISQVNNYPDIIKHITTNRQKNLDIVLHLQSLRRLDTILWQNVRCIRVHYDLEDVSTYKDRLANKYELFKLATIIVAQEFKKFDESLKNDHCKRFCVYVFTDDLKMKGATEKQFDNACALYCAEDTSILKKLQKINNCTEKQALDLYTAERKKQYFVKRK